MATQLQIKRTTVTGRTPNTTNSGNSTYISAGELAINLTDGKLFSSNGTSLIYIGSNVATLNVTSSVNLPNTVTVSGTSGTNGQYLGIVGANLTYASLPPTISIYDASNTLLSNAYFITGSSLNQLSDVDTATTAPANNNLLVWSNGVSNWVPSGNITIQTAVMDGGGNTTTSALTISSNNTYGGTGYAGLLTLKNTIAGATANTKYIRIGNTGTLEIINSSYGSSLFSLTDAGTLNVVSLNIGGLKAVNGPAFSAYANNTTLQTITSGSQQKVLFQTEEFDTDGCYASSRFTPTTAGYYQLNAMVRLDGNTGTGETMIALWRNGSEYKRGWNSTGVAMTTAGGWFAMSVSSTVYANGTTDYFEVYVQQTSGANVTVTGVASPGITYFNGAMIRGG